MQAVLENINPDGASINAFAYASDQFDAPYHFHPEYELTYIKSSHGLRYIGNEITEYRPGELVLLANNLPHCWKKNTSSEAQASSYVIQWKKSLMLDTKEFAPVHLLLQQSKKGLLWHPKEGATVITQMEKIIHSNGLDTYIGLLSLLSELSALSGAIPITTQEYASHTDQDYSTNLEKIQGYVNDHYTEKIKLEGVAAVIGMSGQTFSRFFSKSMQKPFFQYLNEYRINSACYLLMETDKDTSTIAYECGYETLPFFFRQFKKVKGVTPSVFRRNNRG